MKMLTRRGVLVEAMGRTWLADLDADADEVRTQRPLRAAAGGRHHARHGGGTAGTGSVGLATHSTTLILSAPLLEAVRDIPGGLGRELPGWARAVGTRAPAMTSAAG